jgi:hypothetical protein
MVDLPSSAAAFEQAGLAGVLKFNQLVVALNQRDYSWTELYVTRLLQDLTKAIADGERTYFLGTVVTIPRQDGSLEVVDGQQRLATTALLLAAIRDYLKGKEDVIVEAINNEFLTGIDRAKRERIPRLRLNVDDNDLFAWFIAQKDGAIEPAAPKESHRLLKGAYQLAAQHIKNVVAPLDAKDHGDLLNGWVTFLEKSAVVVLVRVPSGANAYKMFETLNDRGLRTSQADLIKNYLFGRSGARLPEVQTRWSLMRGNLETLEEDDITVTFLRQALIMMRGFVREANVYEMVVDTVKSEQGAVTFSSALEASANAYIATFNSEHDKWNTYPPSARRAIEVMNLFNIKPMRPLLLSVASRMLPKEAAPALEFLVSFTVRVLIAGSTRSGSFEESVAAVAHEIFEGKVETVAALKQRLSSITPTDQLFQIEFEGARISTPKFARYYLRSLEMVAKSEPEPWFIPTDDRTIINLEHILPRKPEGNWPQFNADEVFIYNNRLGNQALLRASDNLGLRSDPFATKKAVFANSPYVLTSQIATFSDWTPDSIVQRQKTMASFAAKAWPL